MTATSPELPLGVTLTWSLIGIAAVVLSLVAIWRVIRARNLEAWMKVTWIAVILVLPGLGAIIYLAISPRRDAGSSASAEPVQR